MPCIEARGLRKAFRTTVALDGIDLRVEEGRILGLIGGGDRQQLAALGDVRTPAIADVFVAAIGPRSEQEPGAAR